MSARKYSPSEENALAEEFPAVLPVSVGGNGRRSLNRGDYSKTKHAQASLLRERLEKESQLTELEKAELPPVPDSKRKMTDVLFLFLFVAYWIGMLCIAAVGFKLGNPASLIYGRDSYGRVCGNSNAGFALDAVDQAKLPVDLVVDSDFVDKKYIVFPRIQKDLQFRAAGASIDLNPIDLDLYRVCASECPVENDLVCTNEVDALINQYMDQAGDIDNRTRDELILACLDDDNVRLFGEPSPTCLDVLIGTQCFKTFFNTSSFFFRCFPEFVYEVETLVNETKCLETQDTVSINGEIIKDCVKFQQVQKVTRIEPPDSNIIFDSYNTVSRLFDRMLSDILNGGVVILSTGFGVAGALGLFYILALRYFVFTIIWGTILLSLLVLVGLTLFCYLKAGILSGTIFNNLSNNVNSFINGDNPVATSDLDGLENSTGNADVTTELPAFITQSTSFELEFRVTGFILTGFTLFMVAVVAVSVGRINRAIEFFKEASRCITANPQILLMPLWTLMFSAGMIAFWISATLYIKSSGTMDNGTAVVGFLDAINISNADDYLTQKVFGPFEGSTFLSIYLIFGFFWSMSFIAGVSLMTTSGVVARWYWAGSPQNRSRVIKEKKLKFTLVGSFKTVMKYHLGTVAFGSLLVAFVQLIRYVASFIQARLNKIGNSNPVTRLLFTSLSCCLKCAENCVKFISHNALYMAMLYGQSFCTSTKLAFAAFAHNLVQVSTVTFLGDIILRFGQLLVVGTTMFSAYLIFDGNTEFKIGGDQELNSFLFPVIMAGMLSFFVSNNILSIYHVAIDTILLSYCQDKKLLDQRGLDRDMMADKEMQKFVDRNKQSEGEIGRSLSMNVYA